MMPDFFEITRETEQMTSADIARVRSLINPSELPSSSLRCFVCKKSLVDCKCGPEPEGEAA